MSQHVGKYQLIRKLATGGMAEVYLAKAAGPRGFEKTLVLKRILPHLAEEASFVEMFLAEAMIAARLTHPHIVQIFDFGEADGMYFLAMEYIDGPSLRALVKRAAAQRMLLPTTLCARIIAQACEGLAFAHDFTHPETGQPLGLIHRDISPDNILLSRQGTAKVVDFGIAKAADQGSRTASGVIKGKVSYMPPEQLRAREMDRRVDVYALGVVLYELLTARKPFESTSEVGLMQAILFEPLVPAEQYRPDLPGPLRAILDRALAKERDQRYPDCHAFQSDLEEFILSVGKPVTTQQVAQLIQQVTASGEPSAVGAGTPTPHGAPLSGGTPTHTPRPAPLGDDTSSAPTMQAPRTDVTPPRAALAPEASSSVTVVRAPESPEPSRSGRGWVMATAVGMLLLGGGGAVLWKAGTPPVAPPPAPRVAEAAPTLTLPPSAPLPEVPPEEPPEKPSPPDPEPEVKQKPPVIVRPPPTEPRRPPAPPKSTAKGTLDLRVRPFATVYVDGKKLGDTPLAPPELSAGRHAVRLVNEEHGEKKYDIVIEPNKPYILKVNFFE